MIAQGKSVHSCDSVLTLTGIVFLRTGGSRQSVSPLCRWKWMESRSFFGRRHGSPFDASKRYEFQHLLFLVLPKRQRFHGLHHAGVSMVKINPYETL
jgi:hypothetical protein